MDDADSLSFDVVIVGAGPSGLAAAIQLRQLSQDISVCVLDKGSEVGAHILSGAVLETRALDELIPDWSELGAPITRKVSEDAFVMLTKTLAIPMPTPPQMHNKDNYIISLGNLCRWLGTQAETLGAEIYPGFAVAKTLYGDDGAVIGVATAPMGLDKNGQEKPGFTPSMNIYAKHVMFAEGCRGSLARELFTHFDLRRDCQPQTFGLGIKEIWEVTSPLHTPGKVEHTIGWPLTQDTYGGSFIYHLDDKKVAIGFVVGLDYKNPYLSPFEEFQRFKTHPSVRPLLEGGKRLTYGARALNEGGLQAVPRLSFPGGSLIGCNAGFLNVAKIKGIHTSMKSGMIAAALVAKHLSKGESVPEGALDEAVRQSWIWEELTCVRNIRPGFKWGLLPGLINAALETYIFRGKAPWTLSLHKDNESLKPANACTPIDYPKPDGVVSFDRLSSVFLSNTNHEEDQPCHLTLKDAGIPINHNLALYDAPEQRYCPAGVYEIIREEGQPPRLQINAPNCVHCKTCDIKDPLQNIVWTTPEGGGGPNYPNM